MAMPQPNPERSIREILAVLVASYPNAAVTPATIGVFEKILSDIPVDILEVAVMQHIATARFFPTVAELRDLALSLASPAAQHMTAAEAWGVLKATIRKVGFYRTPQFDDPILAKVVRYMGWQELCASENPEADRAHFFKMYDTLVKREQEDAALLEPARQLRESAKEKLLAPPSVHDNVLRLADKMKMPD